MTFRRWFQGKAGREHRALLRRIVLPLGTLAFVGVLGWLGYRLLVKRGPTKFKATMDTTSIQFVNGDDSGNPLGGLLAGPGLLDVTISGCTSLHYIAVPLGRDTPCDQGLRLEGVQLTSVRVVKGTSVDLWTEQDALKMRLGGELSRTPIGVTLSAQDSGSRFASSGLDMLPGDWEVRTEPGRPLILVLTDHVDSKGVRHSVRVDEHNLPLLPGRTVTFARDTHSTLIGTTSELSFPEISGSDARTLPLYDGSFSLPNLMKGTIRALTARREPSGRITGLHAEILGENADILTEDAYTGETRNAALTFFDIAMRQQEAPLGIGLVLFFVFLMPALWSLVDIWDKLLTDPRKARAAEQIAKETRIEVRDLRQELEELRQGISRG